ncbi:PREDICTED: sperm flagellar protein 1, partial [Tauraco erythrolophus]|uniref:sperm flagellar protein 1 n=1 Tax=Tauraco erythrolophus TaxID=121530 RepID=UPI000523E494
AVLAAEVVKFFFPAMVQLHSYVPASSTPQKLANWGHLNRKVLSKLEFSIPDDVILQVVRCQPGAVEQVLLLLQQKIKEKQKQSKVVPGPGQGRGAWGNGGHPVHWVLLVGAMAKGLEGGEGEVMKSHHGGAQPPLGDAAIRQQLAEREEALLLAQETIQILQLKMGRLEQLVHLKNVRIDDLSRRLQDAQRQQR